LPSIVKMSHKENKMKEKITKVIESIRPYLQADGGDVELVEITEDGVVKVRLTGACGGCPMSTYTLKMGIESKLKSEISDVISVQQVA